MDSRNRLWWVMGGVGLLLVVVLTGGLYWLSPVDSTARNDLALPRMRDGTVSFEYVAAHSVSMQERHGTTGAGALAGAEQGTLNTSDTAVHPPAVAGDATAAAPVRQPIPRVTVDIQAPVAPTTPRPSGRSPPAVPAPPLPPPSIAIRPPLPAHQPDPRPYARLRWRSLRRRRRCTNSGYRSEASPVAAGPTLSGSGSATRASSVASPPGPPEPTCSFASGLAPTPVGWKPRSFSPGCRGSTVWTAATSPRCAARAASKRYLPARGETPAAFEWRFIPAGCGAPRSPMLRYARSSRLASRAPRRSRCNAGFRHGLLVDSALGRHRGAGGGVSRGQGAAQRFEQRLHHVVRVDPVANGNVEVDPGVH